MQFTMSDTVFVVIFLLSLRWCPVRLSDMLLLSFANRVWGLAVYLLKIFVPLNPIIQELLLFPVLQAATIQFLLVPAAVQQDALLG